MGLPHEQRVAVYYANDDIRLETRPVPQPGPGEILVKVLASGICGSDVMEWYRKPRAPIVLGHEVAGQIVAVGEDVEDFAVGDRVVATHHVPCLVCRYCLSGRETACDLLRQTHFDPGGFAEYIRVPAINVRHGVLRLPDHVSDEAGSMVEPLGCVLRGQRKVGMRPGASLLILGAGVSGCLHLLAARARGMGPVLVADPQPERRDWAQRLGADAVHNAGPDLVDWVRTQLGHGADFVVVGTGARAAVEAALQAVDRAGTVLFFAPLGPGQQLEIPFDGLFWRNGVVLTSSYGAAPVDLHQALDLIAAGRVDVEAMITDRLPLDRIAEGFRRMCNPGPSLKILIVR